jgi:glycogen debranching enzyme
MGAVTLIEGSTFCVSDANGDIEPGGTHGLYVLDTRLLVMWRLRLDGRAAEPLTSFSAAPYQATFLGRARPYPGGTQPYPGGTQGTQPYPGSTQPYPGSTQPYPGGTQPYLGRMRPGSSGTQSYLSRAGSLLVRRDRYVGAGLREDVTLVNTGAEATHTELTIDLDCDFADLFEVRANKIRAHGNRTASVEPGALEFKYSLRDRTRGCRIETDERATALPGLLLFRALVPARGEWKTTIAVSASIDRKPLEPEFPRDRPPAQTKTAIRNQVWQEGAPRIETRDARLRQTFERSRADLGSLRIHGGGGTAVAAGAPWYMTLFGRDSLLTAYMALPLDQGLALGTLNELARCQGVKTDEATEEEPGKIVHEVRAGIDPSLNLGGGHLYYGTVDATPLFVLLLGELNRWGVEVEALLPTADRALNWIERASENGFLPYRRRTDRGLVNQGWKDSADGVNFADGRLATPPIAMAEVQGYVYAAYLARAELANQRGDGATRRRCEENAAAIKQRFDEEFWLPDRGWYATALDGDGRPVDALTSNIGHCLWSGIVPPDRARQVADHLLGEAMFTGWGVRTLASNMGAYDPVSYHNGSVWPHDNALVAAGLMRYGLVEHAQRVALGILDAAAAFDGRLPELFCGFDRADYPRPVPYPTSCSPQAWAAAAPVQLLRTLLGLDPNVPRGELRLAPALPATMGEVGLRGVPIAGAQVDVTAGEAVTTREGIPTSAEVAAGEVRGLPETIRLVRETPRPG